MFLCVIAMVLYFQVVNFFKFGTSIHLGARTYHKLHHNLLSFADIEPQMIVVVPCEEALYR